MCSVHSDDGDFERGLRAEMLNLKPKRQLKPSVIPHLNLPTIEFDMTANLIRVSRNQLCKISIKCCRVGIFIVYRLNLRRQFYLILKEGSRSQ